MDSGQVVGHATGPTSALLVKVGANNLVAISEKFRRIDRLGWRCYRIGPEFKVRPLELDIRRPTPGTDQRYHRDLGNQ